MDTEERISTVISLAMQQISVAASSHDTAKISQYTKIAESAEKLKQKLKDLYDNLDVLESELSPQPKNESKKAEFQSTGLRHFRVRVTQGMINQNLLTLTQQVKLGEIRIGEVLRVQTSEGDLFKTELLSPGNKLRERGRVREFYEKAKIRADDFIELIERKPAEWYLRPSLNG